jgi:hypothetical protein
LTEYIDSKQFYINMLQLFKKRISQCHIFGGSVHYMESHDDNENVNEEAAGTQAAPAGVCSGEVRDTDQRLSDSFSRFVQAHLRHHEMLARNMENPLDRASNMERKIDLLCRAEKRIGT